MKLLALWRWRLGLALGALDALWAFSALAASHAAYAGSTVPMIGLMVWIYLHLPAALLASWAYSSSATSPESLPAAELALMGVLGVLQSILIGWLLGRYFDRKRELKP